MLLKTFLQRGTRVNLTMKGTQKHRETMSLSNTQEVDNFRKKLTMRPHNITVIIISEMRGVGVKTLFEKNARTQLVSIRYIHMALLNILGRPRLDCGNIFMK